MNNIIELNQMEISVISGGNIIKDLIKGSAGECAKIAGIGSVFLGIAYIRAHPMEGNLAMLNHPAALYGISFPALFIIPQVGKEIGKFCYEIATNISDKIAYIIHK